MISVLDKLNQIKREGRKILVFGAGVSGFAILEFCLRAGIRVEIWDEISREKYLKNDSAAGKLDVFESRGVRFCFAEDTKQTDPDFSLLITSPGIPPWSGLFAVEKISDLPIISELELALLLFREGSAARHIVVTGSNGKSTTCSLINFLINSCGQSSVLTGNIGHSALGFINADFKPEPGIKYLVVEASSYQLDSFEQYRPDVALMLNLSENHLERHKSMQNYLQAKHKLIANCGHQDFLVIDGDAEWSTAYQHGFKGRLLKFGFNQQCQARVDAQKSTVGLLSDGESYVYKSSDGQLLGEHNLLNLAAAFLACEALQISMPQVIEASKNFSSLEHRLEIFRTESGAILCNDSKSTTVMASVVACKAINAAYPDRRVLLLLGGQEKKGSDWISLSNYLEQHWENFSAVWFFGASSESIRQNFQVAGLEARVFRTLRQALTELKIALTADSLALLTPGCASFDEFKDFEDRGRFFKEFFSRR